MRPLRKSVLVLAFVLLAVAELSARVISYAPVTSKFSRPAVQQRDGMHYLLLESSDPFMVPSMFPGPPPSRPKGSLVIHDRSGNDEPRVIFERDAMTDRVEIVAMNETADGARHILVAANEQSGTQGPLRLFYSRDGGETWEMLSLPDDRFIPEFFREDTGGPIVRGRGSQIRLGNDQTPFIFATSGPTWPRPSTIIYALDASGTIRPLLELEKESNALLIGGDRNGERFLVIGKPIVGGVAQPYGVRVLRLDGTLEDVVFSEASHPFIEGWITEDGTVYLEETTPAQFSSNLVGQRITFVRDGALETIMTETPRTNNGPVLFTVPTHDGEGAWIVRRRGTGQSTSLHRHTPEDGLVEMWTDITSPEVEAVHPARSGERLLIQVHRPRAADTRIIIDPALAIWEVGDPAPSRYEELFLAEGPTKGFVSLDVDAAAAGGAFVFDSAPTEFLPPPPISSAPGGGEVSQEWGVVRASMHQRLVLPALARLPGAYGSFWKSDVTLLNGETTSVEVDLRFVPTGEGTSFEETLVLQGNELRLVEDALFELFGIEQGGGALFITPEGGRAIAVTSRTYSESEQGTYGMGVGAVDLFAASSARFFHTFAGALQGPATRTNLLVTDAGERGARFRLQASGPTGATGRDLVFDVPEQGQIQINDIASWIGVGHQAAARFETLLGQTISTIVSIDNITNDPTLFPPDVVAGVPRVIPMIGHLDGANGSRFRTDLFLYNTADVIKTVMFSAKSLSDDEQEQHVWFTLLPYESKVIPDAYKLVFNREGLGRLRFQSGQQGDSEGIRVSARIYTEAEGGGTYGFVMPALNAFQTAGSGESLEIIGAVIDPRFRTNLALVDTMGNANGLSQRVRIEILGTGRERLDQFDTTVRSAGGSHLTDLFTARGLEADEPVPVIIRVSPLDGAILGAFATMIDNRTNDPMYLGAGLASQ